MNRSHVFRTPLAVALAACAVALVTTPSPRAALEDTRITGQVVDSDGNPVTGVEVQMVPEEAGELTQSATTNKKGRFTLPTVRPRAYSPAVVGEGWTLTAVRASVRRSDGVKMPDFVEDDVRRNGSPVITFNPASRVQMTLTVAPDQAATASGGGAAEGAVGLHGVGDASGELAILDAMFQVGKWDELLERSEVHLAAQPDDGGAHYLRAVALWKKERMDEAATHFDRALALMPEQPGIHGTIGSFHVDRANRLAAAGEAEAATASFVRAGEELDAQLALTPDESTYLVNRVLAAEGAGDAETAVAMLRRMIAVAPDPTQARTRLAEMLIEKEQPEQALDTLDGIEAPTAHHVNLMYNAAVQLWNQGSMDATVAAVDRAIAIEPDNPLLHRLRGRALISTGDKDGAKEALREAIRLAGEDDPATATDRGLLQALESGA
jgi:tetratricopeptide (TPR) repeat protein